MATIADLKKQEKERKRKEKQKKDKQKKVKILLSKPAENREVLDSGNSKELENLLESLLRPAKLETFKYSWSELKKIPKDKRRESRKRLMIGLDKEEYMKAKRIRDNFVFGTNSIIRSLERGKILCGIVSPDFDPAMVTDHIISVSKQKGIPVVLLPELNSICKRCLGFPAKALGLKRTDSIISDDGYKNLKNQILALSDLPDEDLKRINSSKSPPSHSKSKLRHPKPITPTPRDLILKRPNKSSRCFVPGGSLVEVSMDNSDFISFGTSTASKVLLPTSKTTCSETDDDSDSDSDSYVEAPPTKLKPYRPMFQTLKLKKIKSKS